MPLLGPTVGTTGPHCSLLHLSHTLKVHNVKFKKMPTYSHRMGQCGAVFLTVLPESALGGWAWGVTVVAPWVFFNEGKARKSLAPLGFERKDFSLS